MNEMDPDPQRLPPPLVHELRSRSYTRLYGMTRNPGNRGFGLYVRRYTSVIVRREKTLAEKAITVSYLGSFLVDHMVEGMKNATRMIEGRELTDAEGRNVWEVSYPSVIDRFLRELQEGNDIRPVLPRLANYTSVPPSLHSFRQRHWDRINRWLATRDLGSTRQLTLHVTEVLASRRSPRTKAAAVQLAASLMADVECWMAHRPWPEAYGHAMIDLYAAIERHPDVLERLI